MPYSDAKLAEMAKRRQDLKEQEAELKARVKKIDDKIIPELLRRGTRLLEPKGVRITMTIGETTNRDFEALVERVGEKKARRVQKREIDPTLAAQEVQAGRLSLADLEAVTTYDPKAPYITVTRT